MGDFDEDEYFNELFFSIHSLLFYDFDVNDDRIYSLEEEHEFVFDFFYFRRNSKIIISLLHMLFNRV